MNNKEILKAVVERAVKNGWSYKVDFHYIEETFDETTVYLKDPLTLEDIHFALYTIIFSHDFAKAFWGEDDGLEPILKHRGYSLIREQPHWHYHLRQMVLEENPLQYLAQFLKEDNAQG